MIANQYHFELQKIIEEIIQKIKKRQKSPDPIELEIKYASLSQKPTEENIKKLIMDSYKKLIVINYLKYYKSYKVVSGLEKNLMEKSKLNLKNIQKNKKYQVQVKYHLSINASKDIKYTYESNQKKWTNFTKNRLLSYQYNIVSKQRFFRLDLTVKQTNQDDFLKEIQKKVKENEKWKGVLRFKKIERHMIDENYSFNVNTIFHTESDDHYQQLKIQIESNSEQLPRVIEYIVEEQIKYGKNITYELELNFNEKKQIEFLTNMKKQLLLPYLSDVINRFRDLTLKQEKFQSKEEEELIEKEIQKIKIS